MPLPNFIPSNVPMRRLVRKMYSASGDGGRKGGRHQGRGPHSGGLVCKPGDTVRETGIYEVVHDSEHRAAHDAVMLSGDVFPPCDTCAGMVRFHLLRTAPYIFQDQDFEEPESK